MLSVCVALCVVVTAAAGPLVRLAGCGLADDGMSWVEREVIQFKCKHRFPPQQESEGPHRSRPLPRAAIESPSRPLWTVAAQFAPAPRRTVSPRHHGTLAAVGRCYAFGQSDDVLKRHGDDGH